MEPPGWGGTLMYTGPEVAPNGTWTLSPFVISNWEEIVPFVAEKTTSGVSMKLELKVASTVTKSPALAEPGVIELNTIGTRMVAVELPNFVAFWVLVAA